MCKLENCKDNSVLRATRRVDRNAKTFNHCSFRRCIVCRQKGNRALPTTRRLAHNARCKNSYWIRLQKFVQYWLENYLWSTFTKISILVMCKTKPDDLLRRMQCVESEIWHPMGRLMVLQWNFSWISTRKSCNESQRFNKIEICSVTCM